MTEIIQLQQYEQEIENLNIKCKNLNDLNTQRTQELAEERKKNMELQQQIESLQENGVIDPEKAKTNMEELSKAKQENEELKVKIEDLNKQIGNLEKEVEGASEKVENLKKERITKKKKSVRCKKTYCNRTRTSY